MAGATTDDLTAIAWLPLLAMALGIFVIANDVTAMSVALPAMEQDFDTDVSTVQWVVNAYALVFGVLIVTGGRLADMFGRRAMLFAGAGIFAAFSLLGGLAPNVGVLIGALSWRPRALSWRIAATNLVGSVAFGASAIGAYVIVDTGDLRDEVAANAGTFIGAACFLV